jgi:hypothetical protein
VIPDEKSTFEAYIGDVLAYYRQDVTDFLLDVWWAGCQQYAFEDVKRALQAHIQDPDRGQFAPKLADLTRQLGGAATDRSVIAWGIVLEAARSVGAYRDVDFGDAAVHQAIVDLGGWPMLCRTPSDELRHLQHRFAQAFQVYASRGAPLAPLALPGDRGADDTYAVRGIKPPQPTRVLSSLRSIDKQLLLPGPVLSIEL